MHLFPVIKTGLTKEVDFHEGGLSREVLMYMPYSLESHLALKMGDCIVHKAGSWIMNGLLCTL